MSLYRRTDTGEIREIEPDYLAALPEAKRALWEAYTPPAPEPEPDPVPEAVTPRQIRKALNASGLRATVEAAVAAAPQDVRDEWEYALEIRRDYPLMTAMAAQLGMTDAQIDDLFRAAAQL